MKRLHVLYDGECAICCRCRLWLAQQPTFLELRFLPLQTLTLAQRFPGIEKLRPDKELIVVSDEGAVWQGASAWIMCLYALVAYREWSLRLATPALLPLARRACELISQNRLRLSRLLGNDEAELEHALSNTMTVSECKSACGLPAKTRGHRM